MEAVRTSETSMYFKETTRRYIPEGLHLQNLLNSRNRQVQLADPGWQPLPSGTCRVRWVRSPPHTDCTPQTCCCGVMCCPAPALPSTGHILSSPVWVIFSLEHTFFVVSPFPLAPPPWNRTTSLNMTLLGLRCWLLPVGLNRIWAPVWKQFPVPAQ
jgi:hypothetical protein